jgi:hypothetical protein
MNGTKALVLAAALGLAGAALNWYYLFTKSQQLEKIEFLSVAPGATIQPGETFSKEKFAPLAIPKDNVSEQFKAEAILFADWKTVEGMRAVRMHREREILLRQDLKTPPPTLALQANERAIFIPVDTRTFVASLVSPGDDVTFVVGGALVPTPAIPVENGDGPQPEEDLPSVAPPSDAELIGPFRVLSLGNRLGSAEVHKASGIPLMQENVMAVSVKVEANDQLEPKAAKLWKLLQASGFRQVGVLLHPRKPN